MNAANARVAFSEPFAGLTGRGVKIAVIDSGVNLSHPHICAKTEGIAIAGISADAVDQLGHGTAVIAAIQEKVPSAEYFAIKLFGDSLRTTTPLLLHALERAIDTRVDIINLSLGTPNFDYRSEFEALISRAASAGTILVCARSEADRPVLPGCLDGIVSVDVDWSLPRERYRTLEPDGERCYFVASGFPRSLPGIPPRRNLHGTSFAVANMTGFVARACELGSSREISKISDALAAESNRFNF
jgi:hypothetical protein